MRSSGYLRKFGLVTHVTFSVGWLGAVVGFLALSILGLSSNDEQVIRSCYISMEILTWFVILPASLASLLSGIIQSLITPWGLFRHYWVVTKLFLTTGATLILILHMGPIGQLGQSALNGTIVTEDLHGLRVQLLADAAAALVVLIITIVISIYKPWGKIPFAVGRKKEGCPRKNWKLYVAVILTVIALTIFLILHKTEGNFMQH